MGDRNTERMVKLIEDYPIRLNTPREGPGRIPGDATGYIYRDRYEVAETPSDEGGEAWISARFPAEVLE